MSATRGNPSIRRFLLGAAAPASVILALASGPAEAANNTPVPSVPPPNSGSNWSGVYIDPSYDPTSTANSIEVTAARAYAEWSQFNVTAGSSFSVEGMSPDGILVNRVVSVGPGFASDISGSVNAAGQFWLINPNGIVVSNTGSFDVGGLLLSTATGFDTSSFLSGSSLTWSFTGATQPIVVNGTVIVEHGVVALLAPQITIGDADASSGHGAIFEGSGDSGAGQGQVVAIAAQDVSLTFAEDGNLLYELDGATIQRGVSGSGPGPVGGVTVNPSASISASRIFIAAGGETAPVQVLMSGSVTATQARQDGQDIVLMTTDLAPAGSPQAVADGHLSGGSNGPVHDGAASADGGVVELNPQNINTVQDSGIQTDPYAAAGSGVMVRAAGDVLLGDVTNPVGDLDIKANGEINSLSGQGNLAARDIALQSDGDIATGDLNARDDVVVRASRDFSAGAINTGVTVIDQGPTDPGFSDPTEAGERLVARDGAQSFAYYDYDLVGHDVDVVAASISTGAITASDAGGSSLPQPLSDVRLEAFSDASGTLAAGDVSAPRDVLLNGFGDISAGNLTAGRDIAANSYAGNLTFTSGDAQDDIVLGAAGLLSVAGSLTTHGQDSADPGQAGDLLAAVAPLYAYSPSGPTGGGGVAFDVTGSDIDAVAGSIRVGGASTATGAGSDTRFQAAGAIALQNVSAGQDVLIDAGTDFTAGSLTAGRDVAARAYAGSITLDGGIDAQDDVVLRAGADVTVAGWIYTYGQDSTAANQSGDLLAAASPMNAFSATGPGGAGGASFDVTGSTIDLIAGQSISAGWIYASGVDPSLEPANSSDARFQAGGSVSLYGIEAGRDVLIDAGQGVSLSDSVLAGRDVAVRSLDGPIAIRAYGVDAISAGDDIVLRAGGDVTIVGRVVTYGANDPSSPGQAGDLLASVDPIVLHGVAFDVAHGADVDVLAGGAISVTPSDNGGSDSFISTFDVLYGVSGTNVRLQAGDAIALNDAAATLDILIDAGQAVSVADILQAGRDVAVRSRASTVDIGSIEAGDDTVIRAAGLVTIAGDTTVQGVESDDADQAGDLLAADDPLNAYSAAGPGQAGGFAFDEGGSNIDIKAGAIDAQGVQTAAADARFQATGQISLAAVSAGQDILIDAGQAVTTGGLTAGRDVAVRSYAAGVSLGPVDAQDDVVLRAGHAASSGGGITVNGAITTHGANDASSGGQSGDLLVAVDAMSLSTPFQVGDGSQIDLLSHNGGIVVQGAITAQGDARLQTDRDAAGGDIQVAQVTAQTGAILLDGAGVSTGASTPADLIAAQGDVAVRARSGAVTVGAITAGDDIVIRAGGDVTTAGLAAGGGPDTTGAGDRLIASGESAAMAVGTTAFGLGGGNVDVIAGVALSGVTTPTGRILVGGPVTATQDARLQAQGAIQVGQVSAPAGLSVGRDVLLDGALATPGLVQVTGDVQAGRDAALSAGHGALSLAAVSAGDDIVIRAGQQASATGALTSLGSDSAAAGQAGDALAARDPISAYSAAGPGHSGGTSLALTGADIDIKAGVITMRGLTAAGAGADVRLQAPGAVTLAAASAGQDVLIDAGLDVNGGALSAGRDIAVRANAGAVTLGALDAGDDVVLRSAAAGGTGGIVVSGAITTHAGGNDPSATGQAGDLLTAVDPIALGSAVLTVSAAPDVDILAHNSAIDVVGQISAAGGAALQTTGTGAVSTATVSAASGDILLDGATVQHDASATSNALSAPQGDVAVRARSGAAQITSASAGDDVVLRAFTTLTVSGALSGGAGAGADASGAGDQLAALDPITAFWTATPAAIGVAGRSDIDLRAGGAITLGGAVTAAGPGADIRLDSGGAASLTSLQLSGGSGGQVLIAATSLTLPGQIDAAGAELVLVARQTPLAGGGFAPVVLGGTSPVSSGFVFDQAQIARTNVRSLTLFSGADPASTADLVVRDLQYSASLRLVRVYAGPGARIDVTGQVTDPAGTDAVFQAGASPGDPGGALVSLSAATSPVSGGWTPDVIRISGGLGVSGAPLADVVLEARSIYIAPAADAALGSDFEIAAQSQSPESLPAYAGPVTLQVRAGRLDLRAADEILERNLAASGSPGDGEGLQLGGLTINTLGTGVTPSRISLFGALDSRLAGVLPPSPPDTLIDGLGASYLLSFAPRAGAAVGYPAPVTVASYRFNGCIFGGGDCFEQLGPGGFGGIGGAAGATGGATAAGEAALASVAAQSEAESGGGATPGLANPGVVTQMVDPFAPVEDEPVTNTGGEITWPAPPASERK